MSATQATVAAKTAKTKAVAKTAKTAKVTAEKKVRLPAKVLMANRKRMFFGAPYMNAVIGEFCKDHEKMVQHAAHLKLGSPSQLRQLKLETLREKLAAAILSKDDGATPFSIHLQ
jgi:hypothetical protein